MSSSQLIKAMSDVEDELLKAELKFEIGSTGGMLSELEKGRAPALEGEVRTHQSGEPGEHSSVTQRRKKGADGRWHYVGEENIEGRTDSEQTIQDPPPSGRGSNSY